MQMLSRAPTHTVKNSANLSIRTAGPVARALPEPGAGGAIVVHDHEPGAGRRLPVRLWQGGQPRLNVQVLPVD